MKPLLLTDNFGHGLLADGDQIPSAWWMDSSSFPDATTRIVFHNGTYCNVKESPKEIAEMLRA